MNSFLKGLAFITLATFCGSQASAYEAPKTTKKPTAKKTTKKVKTETKKQSKKAVLNTTTEQLQTMNSSIKNISKDLKAIKGFDTATQNDIINTAKSLDTTSKSMDKIISAVKTQEQERRTKTAVPTKKVTSPAAKKK
jgi:hypothetical protein